MITWLIMREFSAEDVKFIRYKVGVLLHIVWGWTGRGNKIGNSKTDANVKKLLEHLKEQTEFFISQSAALTDGDPKDCLWEHQDASFDSFVEILVTIKKIRDICEENETDK